jgi:hypothetical protein
VRRLAVLLGAAAALGAATPAPVVAQGPGTDSVVGGGRVLLTDFAVDVRLGRFGIPTGVLNLAGYVEGTAYPSCLALSGKVAVVAFRLVDGPNAGRGFITEVVDNGAPVDGNPVDATTYNGYLDPDPPTVCPAPGSGPPPGLESVGAGSFTSGDVTITDASPAPAPGKDGVVGWATDCLSLAFGQDYCERGFNFDAFVESDPAGRHPAGHVSWYDAGPTPGASSSAETTVSCLSVSGRVAIIGVAGTWERYGVDGLVAPIAGLIRVVDGGGPASEQDDVRFAIKVGGRSGPPPRGPSSCSTFPGRYPTGAYAFPNFKNERGDMVVVDARHRARQACLAERDAIGRRAFRRRYGAGHHDLVALVRCVARRLGP